MVKRRLVTTGAGQSSKKAERKPVEPKRKKRAATPRSARMAYKHAQGVVAKIMHDVRFGYAIASDGVQEVVEDLLTAVLREPDAAMYLALLNNTYSELAQRSVNVAILALAFGKCISIPKAKMVSLGTGALLCDVGMMRVPSGVYLQKNSLTPQEYQVVQHHVASGVALMSRGSFPDDVLNIVAMHHERFDGSGYPEGLKGNEVPLLARMV